MKNKKMPEAQSEKLYQELLPEFLFDKDVPETLYHYTSSAGLIGIIESSKIWATKTTYLNDSSELQLTFDYIREEVEIQKKNSIKKHDGFNYDDLLSLLDSIGNVNVSVASFSAKGDLLSQWRGYSKIGDGYSLGFDGNKLKKFIGNLTTNFGDKFYLVPCQYEPEIHKKLAANFVNHFIATNISRKSPDFESFDRSTKHAYFEQNILIIAQIIKSKAFEQEEEWRLISPGLPYSDAKFRIGKHALIPYWEIDLNIMNTLKSVIIGPTPESRLSHGAVYGILTKKGFSTHPYIDTPEFNKITIENSRIPYRHI